MVKKVLEFIISKDNEEVKILQLILSIVIDL
jgi:hypothetical protein